MSVEQIKTNISKEKEIMNYLFEIDRISAFPEEKEFYDNLKNSLIFQMKLLNSAIPELLREFRVRTKLIFEMFKRKIVDFDSVQKVINDYYKNPQAVLKTYGIT